MEAAHEILHLINFLTVFNLCCEGWDLARQLSAHKWTVVASGGEVNIQL